MNKAFSKKHINLAEIASLKKSFRSRGLHTVCESALCPNIGECFARNTATFLIAGAICTRGCSFCGVSKGNPAPLDAGEPENISRAVAEMNLRYIVITSVTRDDLADGGASHFARTVIRLKADNPELKIETLVPDFGGSKISAFVVFNSKPDVFSHNIETVPSLYPKVRQGADYERSLTLLENASKAGLTVKSGLMLGLGETESEVICAMKDLLIRGVKILTLGQYLAPSRRHLGVFKHYSDEEFLKFNETALRLGFSNCASGTYVRSSYLAEQMI